MISVKTLVKTKEFISSTHRHYRK